MLILRNKRLLVTLRELFLLLIATSPQQTNLQTISKDIEKDEFDELLKE